MNKINVKRNVGKKIHGTKEKDTKLIKEEINKYER